MKKAILSLTSLILLAFTISLPLRADSVRTTVAIGSSSVGVAANPATNKIYVAAESTGEVVVINGKTQQVTARIDIGRDEHNRGGECIYQSCLCHFLRLWYSRLQHLR